MTSALFDAIDWCVTTFRASELLGAATPPVRVVDGYEPIDLSTPRILWVAVADPDVEDVPESGTTTQSWAALGAQARDEILTISLTARAWTGEASQRTARQAVGAIVAGVETEVRADARLGGAVLVTLPGVTNLRYRATVGPKGAIAQVVFDLVAKARL